mmetsp:Transcript_68924/g.164951  ORF Transcript_68924/g.164951 Transcript_68924/m.164951 type:complete len:101 (-) Transcript_68924:14-316(-)
MVAAMLLGFGATGGAGTKSYHKLSMDHTKCKNAKHPGDNLAEWVPGTCKSKGYDHQMTFGGGFRPIRHDWVQSSGGFTSAQLANYKVPFPAPTSPGRWLK